MTYNVTTYIDIGSGWVEFYPENVESFKLTRDSDRYYKRIKWGKVEIKNNPKLYADTSNDIYRLYDLIQASDFTLEIKVRFETPNITIDGYFGVNDCEPDLDRNILIVTPTIQDEYTDLEESWETDIDFADLPYSTDEIDLNIAALGTETIGDWTETETITFRDPRTGFSYIVEVPAPSIKISKLLYNITIGGLAGFFDGEAPKRTLVAAPPTNFQDYEGFYLADREEILGDDYSQKTYKTYFSGDTYGKFDDTQDVNDVVEYSGDGFTYKSIQSGNTGNQPDISPLWWEKIDKGEVYPEKGDYELSEFTVWEGSNGGGSSVFSKLQIYLYCTTKFSRDEFRKADVVSLTDPSGFEPPSGSGWHIRSKIKVGGQDGHLWTRKPFNGAYTDAWELQDQEENTTGESDHFIWYKKRTTKIFYPDSDNSKTINTTFEPRDLLDYVFQNTNTEFASKNIVSTFLFNDLEAELPILENRVGEAINYVTMANNYLNETRMIFTNDLNPDPNLSDTANYPSVTLKKMLDDLNLLFKNNLYWFINSDGDLQIEHIKYLDLTMDAIDLRGLPELDFTKKVKYDKSKMFNRIELRQINAGGVDFTDNLILFDKIVSNKRNKDIKLEIETEIFTTDLRYCIENASDLDSGILFIATKTELKDSETVITVRNKTGLVSSVSEANGYLAYSNLINDFGRYEGVWDEGTLSGLNGLSSRTVPFETTSRTKDGKEILVKGIKDSLFFITNLGIGLLKDGTLGFEGEESTKLNLSYRYNSTPTTDRFVLMVQKEGEFTGAVNKWFDFGNYST